MLKVKVCFKAVLILSLLLVNAVDSKAQSTILNVPSTDVVAEKETYIEFDFITHPARRRDGGFQYYALRTVYGIKNGFEIGLNASRTYSQDAPSALDLQPNAKWQFYNNEDKGIAAAVGGMMFIPTRLTDTDRFGMIYASVSKQINGKYAPRLTGGFYGLIGAAKDSGTKTGVMIGIEQPVYKKISFAADYMSGKNQFGYITPSLIFTPTERTFIGTGFTIGNEGRSNNGLYFFIGHTF